MNTHTDIERLNELLSKEGQAILDHFKSYCLRTYSKLSADDCNDIFNDCYINCYNTFSNVTESNVKDVKGYFYMVLKNAAGKYNTSNTNKGKVFNKINVESDLNSIEVVEDEVLSELKTQLVQEVIKWVEANFSKKELDMFKFRVLNKLTYRRMEAYSGYKESYIRKITKPVVEAVKKEFKPKLNELYERYEGTGIKAGLHF